jgi:DNA-binding transcriptional regulator LsrR (DeoR family)
MPSGIVDLVREEHGIDLTREAPYKLIQAAAKQKLLRFVPARAGQLSERLEKRYPHLRRVEVVPTVGTDDVAARAADVLVKLLRDLAREPARKQEAHVGWCGGQSMRKVAEQLSEALARAPGRFPRKVVFHALVAGFDVHVPVTDPNAFFAYFARTELPFEVGYVALHAPAIIKPGQMEGLLELPGIQEARPEVDKLDVVVTSAAVLTDPHSMLRRYYVNASAALPSLARHGQEEARRAREMLEADHCVGDMLWLPLSEAGPIDVDKYPYRSMTILELGRLASFVRRGVRVVLALGPCTQCGELKTGILRTILNLPEPLVSDLVTDSRTARQLLQAEAGA